MAMTLPPVLVAGMLSLAGCALAGASSNLRADESAAPQGEVVHGGLQVSGLSTPPGNISLPYVHYRRGGGPRPTVFFLGGGPGVSNLKFVPPKEWLNNFDVVVLEYRGVGQSSIVLESEHFQRALKQPVAGLSLRRADAAQKDLQAAFSDLQRQHVDFSEFSVTELAEDLERLRQHLKLERVHLVAHSFGTRVALAYQTRYREQAEASILFALNTPGGFIWYPSETQQVWGRYRDALVRTQPELAEELDQALRAPSRRPARFGLFPIDDGKALMVAFFLSFNQSTRDFALRALSSANRGHAAYWYMFSLSYDWFIRFGFNWADFFIKAYTSDCDRAAIAQADQQGNNAMFQSPSSMLFSAADAFEAAGGRCAAQHVVPDYRRTLAIVGEFDPSTPIERKPAALPDDHFVVVKGAGHADVLYGNWAASAVWLDRFFLQRNTRNPIQ